MSAFVVTQPVLDVMGRSPETFVFHDVGRLGVIVFAVAWATIPALLLWGLGLASRMAGVRARGLVHTLSIAVLGTVLSWQVMRRATELPGRVIAPAGLALGIGIAALLLRPERVRAWLAWTALAAPASVAMFLFASPVADLVLPAEAAPTARERSDVPVVMVVFDQLPLESLVDPRGRIDRVRHPSFAGLADDATWYRSFTGAARHTRWALPALLDGRHPVKEKHSGHRDHPNTLFALLRESHEMRVFESYSNLCPDSFCPASSAELEGRPARTSTRALAAGGRAGLLGTFRSSLSAWWDLSAPHRSRRDIEAQFTEVTVPLNALRVPPAWADFLDEVEPGGKPPLLFSHTSIPHYPWVFFPSGTSYPDRGVPRVEGDALVRRDTPLLWPEPQWPVQIQRLRHLLQVRYADQLLGTLLDRLRDEQMYDRSLIVVTSDHGIGAGSGSLAEENLHEALWAPLLVKLPDQREGDVSDAEASAIDVLPTIADALGVDLPWDVDGRSLLGPPRPDRVKEFDDPETEARDPIRVPLDVALREIRRDAFPSPDPDDPFGMYRIGPRPELIGVGLDPARVGSPWPGRATLDHPFEPADRSAGVVPALVLGHAPADARTIALVLNGEVGAVVPTYRSAGRADRFSALLPEQLFRDGPNTLDLYVVDGSTFRPLRVA